ncbi:MAG: hypothetical protein ACI85K_001651 [Hyphomicrobiaceae bacterium]|jgi:hypothetical protein
MGNETRLAAIALLISAAACGGGGGSESSGSGNTVGSAFGVVNLASHSPDDRAVQVELDAIIRLEFDSEMALEGFGDEDTWLRPVGSSTNVPVTFTRGSNGRVACQPNSELQAETDYVFQLSALTSDLSGRILDATTSFTFRTFDETPPIITGFSVADGATEVSRTGTFTLSLTEAVDPASITNLTLYLRDVFGGRYACEYTTVGQTIVIAPFADLPGDRQFFIIATAALADRAGNRLEEQYQSSFRTMADAQQPSVLDSWPRLNATDISPLIQPTFTFGESMDPATVEAVSLLFQDEYGSIIPFAISATLDQRTLRIKPLVKLQDNRSYTLAFMLGAASATDVSGNGLLATQALIFTTGTDQQAPTVASSSPVAGETRVPGVLVAEVTFDENIDTLRVNETTIELNVDGAPWASVIELVGDDTVRVTPILTLPVDTLCTLTVLGGQDGVRDLAGNVLATDETLSFTTSADSGLPEAMILPPDGAVAIAIGSRISIVFDAQMDASTLTDSSILITDDFGSAISGTRTLSANNRVVTFRPTTNLIPNAYYRVRIISGNSGARRTTGNWFDSDRLSRFRTGQGFDGIAPNVTASINGIPSARREGLVLPPTGFTIDIATSDPSSQWVDMGSIEVELEGGFGPTGDSLLAAATIGYNTAQIEVPDDAPLSTGMWTMTVWATDLSGNRGKSNVIPFEVDNPNGGSLPFERTQVVWVRTDLDRDGNGTNDFADDMLRLGFGTAGDPNGTNAYMQKVLFDGILAKANHIYHRGSRGEPLDSGSIQLRFTTRQPILLPHMQIGLGGLDPEGDRTRGYGQESTGVLGRAYYDYRNGNPTERNTATSPGLGVFPAEMWLYQADIHQQVYPSFQTQFASKFLSICPDMGGTPAGTNPLDAALLTESFDYDNATSSQRTRWNSIMAAADDWAAVIGIILAHEVGHSVGLVAPGAMPNGLFGDSSLHDTYASAAEVMAPSVGYEAMTSLDYQFRDIDLAYLRMRILLR